MHLLKLAGNSLEVDYPISRNFHNSVDLQTSLVASKQWSSHLAEQFRVI